MNSIAKRGTLVLGIFLGGMTACDDGKVGDDMSDGTDTASTFPDAGVDAGEDTEPGPGRVFAYAGVSLAGGDFGESNLPGQYNVHYIYPEAVSADYFIEKGMNVFRIPFRWERLQRGLSEPFDDVEAERLSSLVFAITSKGAFVVLDPHNYARYDGQLIGTDIDSSHLADFWTRLASLFMADGNVIFGLMNEPHDMETESWLGAANDAIAAVRATGAGNLILVPGNGWTGAHSWTMSYYGTPNAVVMLGVVDPADNFAFEVHQYLDEDSSGTGSVCGNDTIGSERLTEFTKWAREHGYRAFLGEVGSAANDTCLAAIDDMLSYMSSNDDVWLGWTWWAAGPWWGNYFMSIEPSNGQDKPQMETLALYLN